MEGDIIIQQLFLCVHRRSDCARGQRYKQAEEVQPGGVSGVLKSHRNREEGPATLALES